MKTSGIGKERARLIDHKDKFADELRQNGFARATAQFKRSRGEGSGYLFAHALWFTNGKAPEGYVTFEDDLFNRWKVLVKWFLRLEFHQWDKVWDKETDCHGRVALGSLCGEMKIWHIASRRSWHETTTVL